MSCHPPLPPPLLVAADGGGNRSAGPKVNVLRREGCDVPRAEAFGAILAAAREARGDSQEIVLFAASDPARHPPAAVDGQVWLPHVFCWRSPRNAALAWEISTEARLPDLAEASADDVLRWAQRPDLILRLCHLAGDAVAPEEPQQQHLSFRWLMANQETAAAALADEAVALEHVSLHVDAAHEAAIVRALTTAIGLVEIPRPASITTPGRWLQAGNCRVHLNSRSARGGEQGFPGTAPNHVCFAVADVPAVARALEQQGFATEQAGSLSQQQVWLRLPGEIVIELQGRL